MKEAPENGKELSHSAHANGLDEWTYQLRMRHLIVVGVWQMNSKTFKTI